MDMQEKEHILQRKLKKKKIKKRTKGSRLSPFFNTWHHVCTDLFTRSSFLQFT